MGKRNAILGVVAGAVLIAAAAFTYVRFNNAASPAPGIVEPVSAAEARAIGARWRQSGGDALGRTYAQALISAGLYDELLTEIAEHGLFAGDADASRLYRAEANLREGRFDEALSATGADQNPYLAFARARAVYAITADESAVAADLASALRGPKELAGEAFLFRARLALDANDFDSADAAARRAAEAGVAPTRTENILIEKSVREGELDAAARSLEARRKTARGVISPDDYRLAAILRLRAGDAAAAVRLIDRARGVADTDRTQLLSALAKHLAGDDAQAYSLAASHLSVAPKDWAALDLAAIIARDMGRKDEADRLLDRLAEFRPALATIRRMRAGAMSPDAAFDALIAAKGDLSTVGLTNFLLGPEASVRGMAQASDDERALAEIAGAIRSGEPQRLRKTATRLLGDQSSPVGLALAGAAFIRLDDAENAARALSLSATAAPDFLAPVLMLASLRESAGAGDDAAALLRAFLVRQEGDARARLALAAVEARRGDMTSAVENYAKVPPETVFGDERSAVLYGATAKIAGGAAHEAMLKAARASAATPRILGLALAAAGDTGGAAAALRQALLASPDDAEIAQRYQEAMIASGRAEEAVSLIAEIQRRRAADADQGARPAEDAEPRKTEDFEVNIRQ